MGIGLIALWLVELASPPFNGMAELAPSAAARWITWFDLLAALIAFSISAKVRQGESSRTRGAAPILLSGGLFILFVVGLASPPVPAWMTWWNFAFACAFLFIGLIAGSERDFAHIARRRRGSYGTYPPALYGWFGGYPFPFPGDELANYPEPRVGTHHIGKGPRSYQRSDERILEEIADRLMAHPEVDASEVTINVVEGHVTLDGSVETRHARRLAEAVADSVSGVRDLVNHLHIHRPGSGKTRPFRAA